MTEPENTTEKPQQGTWNSMKGYPAKITFKLDQAVAVNFEPEFTEPKEMPSTDGKGVYYIFDCLDGNGTRSCIMTSAWSLLNSLKTHMPLAGKTLIITQKNVKGKKMYYVNLPDRYGTPETEQPEQEQEEPEGI